MPSATTSLKSVLTVQDQPRSNWIGDGFRVYDIFNYRKGAEERSPFLLLHYAAPMHFEPNHSGYPRGVSDHPHRGFETVTVVYDGEVEHRDSTGAGGVIGPGDVQWMTAGGGIMHREFHSQAFSEKGGAFEIVQFWVNLPAQHKMTPAHYQGIQAETIAEVCLPDQAGRVRVIAGELNDSKGPATTYTPMNVWDVRLQAGKTASLPQPEGWTALLLVQTGSVHVNGHEAHAGQLVTLSREHSGLELQAAAGNDVRLLLLTGEPIDEPIVASGPFVMNTAAEVAAAYNDLTFGKFRNIE